MRLIRLFRAELARLVRLHRTALPSIELAACLHDDGERAASA